MLIGERIQIETGKIGRILDSNVTGHSNRKWNEVKEALTGDNCVIQCSLHANYGSLPRWCPDDELIQHKSIIRKGSTEAPNDPLIKGKYMPYVRGH